MRKGADDLHRSLDGVIHPTAQVAGNSADGQTQHDRYEYGYQSNGKTDPRPVDDPTQNVSSISVGSKQKERLRFAIRMVACPEKMVTEGNESPKP